MTRKEAIKWLIRPAATSTEIGEVKQKEFEAYNMAIEALSAEEAVWNEYEAEFTDLPDIPRYYYEKVVGKMAHEINMLKEQLESADAVQDGRNNIKRYPNCQMRTSLGNCDAIGGFCTSINAPICDAFHKLSEAVQGWIPCSERLPEKGEVVLITNGKGNVRCGQYRSEHDVRDGTHYWWWKGKTVETVLAWMPLPKPYREDGEA